MKSQLPLLADDFAKHLVKLGYVSQEALDRGLIESITITASGVGRVVTVEIKQIADSGLLDLPEVTA